MLSSNTPLDFVALAFVTFLAWIAYSYSKNTRLAYYPGPRGYPLIGNALQIGRFPWIQLAKWSEEYGPIYSVQLGPQYALIVNSHRIANELLDRRSAIYSDRPRMIMLNEIMTQHLFLPTIPYGDSWRKLRKAISEVLNHRSIESFLPVVQRKMILLVETLAKNPHDTKWMQDIIASISMTAFALGYGDTPSQSCSGGDESSRKEIEDFMHRVERTALPGEHLVELLPWLNRLPTWFPGMKWKTRGLEWHEKDTQMFEKLYKDAATAQKEGKSSKSFVSITSKEYEAHEVNPGLDLTFKERAWMAGNLYGAGSSTTSAFALMFILAMVTNPQVMRKAQAQIDEVVGRDRTPCLKDKEELPYIRALLREVFRWRSGSPLGVPHYSTEDGEYDGRFIPKGTLIMFNVWAMNREYPTFLDPDNFRPERFLDETETKDYVPPHTHIDVSIIVQPKLFSIHNRLGFSQKTKQNRVILRLDTVEGNVLAQCKLTTYCSSMFARFYGHLIFFRLRNKNLVLTTSMTTTEWYFIQNHSRSSSSLDKVSRF
ncbi:cytochrome P450 [Abortiporus biennis]|nr:cytochrome P450 [Abortiporus biennis]